MKLIYGTASRLLGERVAEVAKIPVADTTIKRFPDGECYVKINDDVEGEDVVIIQNTYPDENIIELFLIQEALKESGAKNITTVIPYYGYSRQDRVFEKGEGVSAKAMARHIELHAAEVIVVDPHKESIAEWFKKPVQVVHAYRPFANYLKTKDVSMIFSPDRGSLERAEKIATLMDVDYDYFRKTRLSGTVVEVEEKEMDLKGRNVAIVDDIISTGGTIVEVAKKLKEYGARKVVALATHGLFTNNALPRLKSVVDDIATADTIENPVSMITMAQEIALTLK